MTDWYQDQGQWGKALFLGIFYPLTWVIAFIVLRF